MVQSLLWEGDLMPESQASSMSALRDRNPQPEVATRLKRLLTLLLVLTALIFPGSIRTESNPIYLDPQQPIERRVEDLLSGMTLEEKVGQLNLPCVYVDQLGKTIPEKMQACKRFAAGTYTNEIGPGAGFFTLADTIFHEGLAIGSSFDMPLVEQIYAAAARESRAVGIHVLSTLVLELDRDPRMGRNEEGYTEDTYLLSRIAEATVRGAQGTDISPPDKAVALLTDFPTQSEPLSGLERGAVTLSDRMLRRDILPPWAAGITKNDALGVMAGYPEIEDMPAHGSKKWMNDVLRDELGFRGIVVSEGGGFGTRIYEGIVPTQKEAGALALKAGVDINITYEPAYMRPLIENVKEGRVPMELIDRAVRRMLELKFRLGLFEHPYVDVAHAKQIVHSKEHQQLALNAAREGIVLLKNENNVLPLKKDVKSIAVIGPNANSASNLFGDYSAQVVLQHVDSVLDGIKAKVSPATRVFYAGGCAVNDQNKSGFEKAVQAAKNTDVAIVVLGEQSRREGDEAKHLPAPTDGEGYDVASLDLTGVQEDLLKAIRATGTPTVLILINGRPLSIRWASEHVPAIVEAWQPGERGAEAIADVLFGDYNPSGRLAITIPRSVGQLPVYYSYPLSKEYWIKGGWTN